MDLLRRLDQIDAGTLEVELFRARLSSLDQSITFRGLARVSLRGHRLECSFYASLGNAQQRAVFSRLNNGEIPLGQIVPNNHYFKLSGHDLEGMRWEATDILVHFHALALMMPFTTLSFSLAKNLTL